MNKAIELIEETYPDHHPEKFVEVHEDNPRTEAFGTFFQIVLNTDNPGVLDDDEAKFTVTFELGLLQRLKILLFGKHDAPVGPLLTEAVGFGMAWKKQNVLETLEKHRCKGENQ